MSKWLEAIAAERRRQVDKFEYTAEHDANECHQCGELAMAASFMAWPDDTLPEYDGHPVYFVELLFPVGWDQDLHSFREGKTAQERLVVAGALILAELDRLEAGREDHDAQ